MRKQLIMAMFAANIACVMASEVAHVERSKPLPAMLSAFALACDSGADFQSSWQDALYAGFLTPPDECRPDIWLFRLGEDTPDEVVTYDFEKLAGVGIGGVCVYGYGNTTRSAAYGRMALKGRPKLVGKLRWALREAHRLNLDLSSCIGPAGCGNELTSRSLPDCLGL